MGQSDFAEQVEQALNDAQADYENSAAILTVELEKAMGEDISEQLGIISPRVEVTWNIRRKYACPCLNSSGTRYRAK